MRLVPLVLSICVSFAPLLAQRVIVVDDTMAPGADYPDLVTAHAVANPGDRIHVRPGSGAGYAAPATFDKPLRILGIGSVKPLVWHFDTPIACPAGQMLIFDNLEFRAGGRAEWATAVQFSPGLVVLSRVSYPGQMTRPVNAYDCGRVVLVDTDIVSPSATVYARNSRVWILNCRTTSAWASDSFYYGAISNRSGGEIWIVGGQHVGGDGYEPCWPWQGYNPQPAVYAFQGHVFVSGPADLLGGRFRWGNSCPPGGTGYRTRGFAAECFPSTASALDPMVQTHGVWTPCPMVIVRETPAVIPGPAARGQRQTIDCWAPTNAIVAVFASFLPAYDPIRLPIGDVWLDPYFVLHVATGTVDAQRRVALSTTIPAWLPIGEVLVYQAVSLSQQNQFEISAPGLAVVH